ncbi:RNA polymerase sigma factor [Nonomuraea typhae]|uniref:RNA polymerase sigma factor n=1 Tax=Nonomuraea typhae TaxID=2603600 RepID=A0ABW7YSB6_9ACTN
MAGWPTVDRADDHELAAALRRAGKDAPARLYDAYAERLHDYACSLTGDRDSAADSVHDALVTAQAGVGRLKETARLRPWLYALTRFQAAARTARADGAAPGMPPPVLDEPEDPELAALVHEVRNELSRNEREVLELSLRHGLTPAEVGAVLGLTSRQSAARLTRARDHLENAAAAVVLARTGRAHCPDLSAMVDSWEGPLTPLLRRRLSGHIGGCEVCTEGKQRQVAAAALLDMVPVAFPPISLRRRVVGTCLDPGLEHTRTLILERGENFDRAGFPVNHHADRRTDRRAGRRTRRRRPRSLAPVLLAGAAVLAGTGAMVLMGAEDGTPAAVRQAPSPPSPTGSRAPMAIPTDEPPEEAPEETTAEEPDPSTPEPEETTAEPSATTRRPAPSATRPAGDPAPTRRPAPPAARLSIGCPDSITGAAKIGLRARNASVTWSAAVSAGMGVFPARGTLRAGRSASIWVTIDDPDAAGGGSVAFTSNGGAASCSLSWRGRRQPTAEPTPSEDPTPTAEPTETPDQSATGDLVASK